MAARLLQRRRADPRPRPPRPPCPCAAALFAGAQYAQRPIVKLTLRQMLELGQAAWLDQRKVIESAEFVREEVGARAGCALLSHRGRGRRERQGGAAGWIAGVGQEPASIGRAFASA